MTPTLRARLGAYAFVFGRHAVLTSAEIGDHLDVNPTQVRRDLGTLGSNGTRGTGYRADVMLPLIRDALAGDATGGAAIVVAALARRVPAADTPTVRITNAGLGIAAAVLHALDAQLAGDLQKEADRG